MRLVATHRICALFEDPKPYFGLKLFDSFFRFCAQDSGPFLFDI